MTLTEAEIEQIECMVKKKYKYKFYVDDLPSATLIRDKNGHKVLNFQEGIPIGVWDSTENSVIVFNHLELTVYTHKYKDKESSELINVVGFEVEPKYLGEDENRMVYDKSKSTIQKLEPGVPFRFSYRFRFVVSLSPLIICFVERRDDNMGYENVPLPEI